MIKKVTVVFTIVVLLVGIGYSIRKFYHSKVDSEALTLIKEKHADWHHIDPVREVAGSNQDLLMGGKRITYVVQFRTKSTHYTWYYSDTDKRWMDYDYATDKLVDP
jgi:hypothetical protein